jgi:hypothetical protein
VLRVPGVPGGVTCRTNPADAHHWWYWADNEAFATAHHLAQAREAAEQLLKRRDAATAPATNHPSAV